MSDIVPKKMLIMNIYDILKKYSDAAHPITQKMIIDKLRSEYYMEVDRKSVKRNLDFLCDSGMNIKYDAKKRNKNSGETEEVSIGWYMLRDFTDSELHFLIDNLIFVRNMPVKQAERLVEKLCGLSGKYFKHDMPIMNERLQNYEYFLNVEVIYEAIENGKQITFLYNAYDTDKKLHPLTDENGAVKQYIVDPYRMAMTDGRYYLIGREKGQSTIEHYQVDRITNIDKLDTALQKVKEIEHGFDLSEYISEHVNMFSGKSERVVFRADRKILSDIIDRFGSKADFMKSDENYVTASVRVNSKAMKYWAIQYLKYVTVISPKELADDIRSTIAAALDNYSK